MSSTLGVFSIDDTRLYRSYIDTLRVATDVGANLGLYSLAFVIVLTKSWKWLLVLYGNIFLHCVVDVLRLFLII